MSSVKARLGIIVLAPTLALSGFAAAFVGERWSQYQGAAGAASDMGLVLGASEVVHRLQIERGLTVWGLTDGRVSSPKLDAARQRVDQAVKTLRTKMAKSDPARTTPVKRQTARLLSSASALPSLRRDADARDIDAPMAMDRYTVLVSEGLAVVESMSRSPAASSQQIARSLAVYSMLASGKEIAGRERAIGAAALAAPKVAPREIARIVALSGAQQALFLRIPADASPRIEPRWTAFLASPENRAVETIRSKFYASARAGPTITPAQWFSAHTARIDALHALETVVASETTQLLGVEMTSAMHALVVALLISVLAVAGASIVALLAARSLVRPIEELTAATRRLADGDLETEIASIRGLREVATLVRALQSFRDGLRANRALTRELADVNRLTSLGALVAGISHEINTPIGNALMVASSFTESTERFAKQVAAGSLRRSSLDQHVATSEEAARLIETNLRRASEQIRSFKQMAADQTSNFRRSFSLRRRVNDAVKSCTPLLRQAHVQTQIDIPDDIRLEGYPGALTQVVVNLVENAVKHGLADRSDGMIRIEGEQNGARVRLVVGDNGVGIPEEVSDKVFSAFFTTRAGAGGTGLGLHIVKSIIGNQLGGEIELGRSPDGGAQFVIDLPIEAPAATPSSNADEPQARAAA